MSGPAIEPGLWMEALKDELPYYAKGSIWRVARVWPQGPDEECSASEDCRGAGIIFVGMRMPAGANGACSCGFRPIYRPKSEIIEALTQPAPDAVRELITEDA